MSAIKIVHDDRLFLIDGPISDLLEYYEELKAAAAERYRIDLSPTRLLGYVTLSEEEAKKNRIEALRKKLAELEKEIEKEVGND